MNAFPLTRGRFCSFFLFLFLFSHSFGQDDAEYLSISPKWMIGDTKKVHVDEATRVIFDDSVVKNLHNVYDVVIKVYDTEKENYILKWSCKNDMEMLQYHHHRSSEDPMENRILEGLKSAEKKVLFMNLTLLMDMKTGEIKEWLNGRELLKNVEFQEKKKIKAWCVANEIPEENREDMELDFSKKLTASYSVWRSLLLQKSNFFFESFNQRFFLNQTLTEDVVTKNILDLQDDDTEFPGTLTKEATEVNDRLILDKKVEYDKEFLTNYLKTLVASFETLSSHDVMVFEKEQTIFDLKTTWILNYSKKLYFEVKGMKTTSTTTVTFI